MVCRKCLQHKDEKGFQRYTTSAGNPSVRKTCKACRLKSRKPETVKANSARANNKRKLNRKYWNQRMVEYRAKRKALGIPIVRNCKSDKYRATGYFKFWIRAEVFRIHGSKCRYCSQYANTIDHVIPLARGGSNDLSNLVPACKSCNSSKQAKLMSDWKPNFKEVSLGDNIRG